MALLGPFIGPGFTDPPIYDPSQEEVTEDGKVVVGMSPSSQVSSDNSFDPYSLINYLSTLTSTVGMENKLNREYNSAQAALNRDWSAEQVALNRTFNAEEAEKNREFQRVMSNTAYQRALSDMKAAGLNPILMASSGFSASSPSGSAASGSALASSAASYNYGGGDTLSSLLTGLAHTAQGLASILELLPWLKRTSGGGSKIGFK